MCAEPERRRRTPYSRGIGTNLTLQYFTIHLIVLVFIAAKQFVNMEILDYVTSIFGATRMTVVFASMLSMFVIRARMRALPLALHLTKATDGTTPATAGPQNWYKMGCTG